MKLFTVKLADDERQALEAIRVAYGARSQADAVRRVIAEKRVGLIREGKLKIDYGAAYDEAFAENARLFNQPLSNVALPVMQQAPRGDPTPISQSAYAALRLGPARPKPGSRLKKAKP